MKPYFDNLSERIIEQLNQAEHQILVAVAWITETKIIDALAEKARQGIKVEILISAKTFDEKHKEKQDSYTQYLFLSNCLVYKIGVDADFAPLMHHKFCVIDNHILITGSYNWTVKASSNDEDIIINDDFEFAQHYIDRFIELKQKLSTERLWFNRLSYSWQQIFKKVIGIDHEPSENELNKIKSLTELDISAAPKTMRDKWEIDFFNELIQDNENLDDLNEDIYRRIAHIEFEAVKDLEPISFLKKLRILNCSGTDIQSLVPVSKLKLLEDLDISMIEETLLDFAPLKSLTGLKRIHLGCTKINNWEFISYLKNLEEIHFSAACIMKNVSITTLMPLKKLIKLKYLDINGLQVDSLEPLTELVELESLYADYTLVNDLSPLYNLERLREVYVPDTTVSKKNLKALEENNPSYYLHKRKRDEENKKSSEEFDRMHQEMLASIGMTEDEYDKMIEEKTKQAMDRIEKNGFGNDTKFDDIIETPF